jgi:adenylate cyclase
MPEQQITRRLAAILAADVVGYSRMMGADEAGTVAALRHIWSETFNPAVAAYHGRIVKTMGDGALVEFGSAIDAVECAVAVQRAMAQRNQSAEPRFEFRIGINLGDIIIDGDDILGDGVNIAARLESQAPHGGILASDVVHAQVHGKVGVTFADAGEIRLKNIERPQHVWRWDGNGAAPSAPAAVRHAPADKPSIAVLPFTVMSHDAEQEFFADGLVDDILTTLSKLSGLDVIARNSSFIYKGRAVDVRQVGRELGVRYVLEGSVRKAGNRIRITAQLIDAATGAHIWADRFDRSFDQRTGYRTGSMLVTRKKIVPRRAEDVFVAEHPAKYAPLPIAAQFRVTADLVCEHTAWHEPLPIASYFLVTVERHKPTFRAINGEDITGQSFDDLYD